MREVDEMTLTRNQKMFKKPNLALKKIEGPQFFNTKSQMALEIFGLFWPL